MVISFVLTIPIFAFHVPMSVGKNTEISSILFNGFCCVYLKDLVRSYSDDVDRVERQYKQRMRKSEADFRRQYNDTSAQLKSQQVAA